MLGDDPDDPGRDAARSAGPPPRARRSRRTRSSVTAAARPRSPGVEARDADGVPGRPPASDDRAAAISSRAWSRACSVDTCCFSCSVSRAADVLPATPAAAQPMASAATTARGHRKRPMTRHDTLPRRKGGPTMTTRREFLGTTTGALAGLAFVGCDLLAAAPVRAQTRRREVVVSGRRVKTVDVHAHCAVAEAMALVGMTLGAPAPPTRPELSMVTHVSERLRAMDEQGIDVEALSINPYWYKTERDLARQICQIQNSKLGEACAANPDRFVAFASVALQYPDLAAQQLEDGVKKYGLRGAAIGGSVNGEELSDPKFHPFWAKAEQLGVLVFIHPQGSGVAAEIPGRFKGNGLLANVIGNPLETTIALSHLIFEGTLDRFPGLKICAAHGGGYLPSYAGRSDQGCLTFPDRCPGTKDGPLKKKPTEYLKQLYYDNIMFTPEAMRHLVAEVGAGQIVVGTDFPYPWTKTAVDLVLATPGLSDAERAAMLGGTAAKLLGINA